MCTSGGTGWSWGCAGDGHGPDLPACPSGLPPAQAGAQREETAATGPLPAAPCGSPAWVPLCFVLHWRMPGAVSGVWSSTWDPRSLFLLETANGAARTEPAGCGGTPGEGGEMDGEDKQNQRRI